VLQGIDSFYLFVKGRIQTKNPTRQVVGVMSGMDWPPETVQMESFYLLILGEAQPTKTALSAAVPIVVHTLQWVWLIAGTDIQANIQIRSRGDRYRTNQMMKEELLYGLYPYFSQKNTVTVSGNGALVVLPVVPTEFIRWSRPVFLDRNDKKSGLVYGSCSVHVTDMTEFIAA
jgi:hypothetical protein